MRLVRQSDGQSVTLDPAAPLGIGGEARVFALPHEARLCAKIYHHSSEAQARKLEVMIANPPDDPMLPQGHISIAWPTDLLSSPFGACPFVGYLMPRVVGMRPLFNVYNPVTRRKQTPLFNYLYLHRAAQNMAHSVKALHSRGYVIGDINESNVLVTDTALVTLVDTDSFQVRDREQGAAYRCPVGKPEFTPAELQGVNFQLMDRQPEHDRFGLAVLIFQLLMEGTHPFSGIYEGNGDPPHFDARIREGHFTYGVRKTPYRPMPHAPGVSLLHPALYTLFLRCFETGHRAPEARPGPQEWIEALKNAEEALTICEVNGQHRYGNHLPNCPWCVRMKQLGGRDPFPLQPQEPYRRPDRQMAVGRSASVTGSSATPIYPASASASTTLAGASVAALPVGASNLPQWPLAPTALPTQAGAPLLPAISFPPYHPATWVAGSMAILAVSLPGFQFLSGLLALLCGILAWRYSQAGRKLSLFSAVVGAIMIGYVLIGAAGKSWVKAPARTIMENGPIRSVAFSPDGQIVATATERNEDQRLIPGQIALYNTTTGDLARTIIGVSDMASVAYSPDGNLLAAGSGALLENGTVKLYEAHRGTPRLELPGFRGDVNGLAFSRDSKLLVTGSRDKSVIVWDCESGKQLRTFEAPGEVFGVAVSPDSRLIAAGSGSSGSGLPGYVSVWDFTSGTLKWSQKAHSERALSVAFNPNGSILASAGNDNTLRIWDPMTGRLLRMLETRNAQTLNALAFSSDGKTVVTGGDDGITRLWDLSRGTVIRNFVPEGGSEGADMLVEAVACSPDGRFIASGGRGGAFHIWRLH